jgi:hypothetical protein
MRLSDTLTVSEQKDGFWLYDSTRGMNLSIRAKTKDAAFVAALTCYQNRLKTVEREYAALKSKVDEFVEQFVEKEEDR